MRHALGLARRGLGNVWPNPAVGCLIVCDGRILARGWTQPGGRPHAESEALERAGDDARGATAYVTLEPCSHHGRTPPCADSLIAAGVARVVVATGDPDARVTGRGLTRLRDAGIAVEVGLLEAEARDLNAGFFKHREARRPVVGLKLATTLDGRTATVTGESRWITGPVARAWVHRLRAEADAILVGSGTALADDPALTCRLPGLGARSPVRVVLDGRGRLGADSVLVATAGETPTWRLVGKGVPALPGVVDLVVPAGRDGHLDLEAGLATLAREGITRVMVEGGRGLATALMRADLVDSIDWFRAPALIGGDGMPALDALGIEEMGSLRRWRRRGLQILGDDILESLAPTT